MSEHLRLQTWYEPAGRSIRVTYRAENISAESLYLYNALFVSRRPTGEAEVDPNLAWVRVGTGSVIHFDKKIPEVPDDVDVEYRLVPCASHLQVGQVFQETFVRHIPVEAFDPYKPPDPNAPRHDPVISREARFSLGYSPASEIDAPLLTTTPTTAGPLTIVTMSYLGQRVAEAEPTPLAIPVVPERIDLPTRTCTVCGTTNVGLQPQCLRCGTPLTATPPGASGFAPTHHVPPSGLDAWPSPDATAPPSTHLDPGLPVQVVDRLGDWAKIMASNGWTAWVDARVIVPNR
jgi:SH3 domain-containing protein